MLKARVLAGAPNREDAVGEHLLNSLLEVKLGTNTAHIHLILEAYDRWSSVMPAYPVPAGGP